MSEDKKSKTPGIDSCPAYNTRSQRIESQLHGGKTIDEEKDEKIENLLARLSEQHNLISKLTGEWYVEKNKYRDLREDKDYEILQLKKQIELERRQIRMLRERLKQTSLYRKVEHFRKLVKSLRKRLVLQDKIIHRDSGQN